MNKQWYTAKELSELKLAGLPSHFPSIIRKATKEGWKSQPRAGKGGGKEYHVSSLPVSAKDDLARRELLRQKKEAGQALAKLEVTSKEVTVGKEKRTFSIDEVSANMRITAEARSVFVLEIERMIYSGYGISRAIHTIVKLSKSGQLNEELSNALNIANPSKKGKPNLCRATLFNWIKAYREDGINGLIPAYIGNPNDEVPKWAGYFMRLYQVSQKPSISTCLEELKKVLPKAIEMPSYDQARGLINKLGAIDKLKGRVGFRELKKYRAYKTRDKSNLFPGAVYSADGHTFDAEIQNPLNGKIFRPEITTVIDVYTRKIVGWSVSLSENTIGVSDALRNAVTTNGIPVIWYVDGGKGFNNKYFDQDVTGILSRLGITKFKSLPYNSQARGVCERVHQSVWVRASKMLKTYIGHDVDPEFSGRVHKTTRKDIKINGESRLLMPFNLFLDFCKLQVHEYNNRPHSGVNGQTPNQVWDNFEFDGLEYYPEVVIGSLADDLFRPAVIRTVRRCLIEVFNNQYFSHDLEQYHGEQVYVGYDIHDASRIVVRELDGEDAGKIITIAEIDGNKTHYFPTPVVDQALEKHITQRVKRLEHDIADTKAMLPSPRKIKETPLTPAQIEMKKEIEAEVEGKVIARIEPKKEESKEDIFLRALKMEQRTDLTEEQKIWLERYKKTPPYKTFKGFIEDFGIEALFGNKAQTGT